MGVFRMLKSEGVATYMQQNNANIHYLIGNESIVVRPMEPYYPLVCDFLNDLSIALCAHPEAAAYSDIVSFAFWCRKSQITELKAAFNQGRVRLGLGLVFHVTPSNVPINFAFSWAFGLLAGNANIVRVPSKPFPQVNIICDAINKLFSNEKYHEIQRMQAIVQYKQNDEITRVFSSDCNARIIWGGDETIKNIRKFSIPNRSIEIVFSDRYSFCVIDAPSVVKLDEIELKKLAINFYNDVYLMDQNACSSPHLIVWLGEKKEEAKERFWLAVHKIVVEKYRLEIVSTVDKYTQVCQQAIELDNMVYFKRYTSHVYRVGLDRLPDNMDTLRGKCGYFYEYDSQDINHIAHIINTKYQTLTYFGVDKDILVVFVLKNHLLGIDRIVPVGKALDIGVVWDGYDIINSLARIIDIT